TTANIRTAGTARSCRPRNIAASPPSRMARAMAAIATSNDTANPRLLGSLDDVEPERRLHELADLADLQREGCIGERLDHDAAIELTEIAPALGGARLVAAFLDHGVEIGAGADLLQTLLRPLARLFTRSCDALRLAL